MKNNYSVKAIILVVFVTMSTLTFSQQALAQLPENFVYAKEVIPNLRSFYLQTTQISGALGTGRINYL